MMRLPIVSRAIQSTGEGRVPPNRLRLARGSGFDPKAEVRGIRHRRSATKIRRRIGHGSMTMGGNTLKNLV